MERPITRADEREQVYEERLQTLSDGAVRRNFDPYQDIDWDAPENEIRYDDERWILGEWDPLGRHEWYKSLPKDEQIRIGIHRFALMSKVGLQFEQGLVAGIMLSNVESNQTNEIRATTHESVEEGNHILMFNELVRRTGIDTMGAPSKFRKQIPIVTALGTKFPALFWFGVLAGEEPIDHTQKEVLRNSANVHPLMARIMAIHVAEEARHISLAHEKLKVEVPKMSRLGRAALAVMVPGLMIQLARIIAKPSRKECAAMGIPPEVAEEVWGKSAESRKYWADLFPDTRMLADELGLRKGNLLGRLAWKAWGIDGRASRYRGEPDRRHK